jgi:hypothetical protein
MIIPHFMYKYAIDADGKDLYAKLLEFTNFFGDRRNFGRSDEGKIARVETQHNPLAQILRKFYLDEFA